MKKIISLLTLTILVFSLSIILAQNSSTYENSIKKLVEKAKLKDLNKPDPMKDKPEKVREITEKAFKEHNLQEVKIDATTGETFIKNPFLGAKEYKAEKIKVTDERILIKSIDDGENNVDYYAVPVRDENTSEIFCVNFIHTKRETFAAAIFPAGEGIMTFPEITEDTAKKIVQENTKTTVIGKPILVWSKEEPIYIFTNPVWLVKTNDGNTWLVGHDGKVY